MSPVSEQAEALKVKGNEKYLACAYAEAICMYKAAVKLQPHEPIYLSNLSAVQLEDFQYAEALVSCTAALSLIGSRDPKSAALRLKLLGRRAKLLTFLYAKDTALYSEASAAYDAILLEDPENNLANVLKSTLERLQDLHNLETKKINKRLTDTPRYRCTMKNMLEYYTVGHDDANSIFRCQYTSEDDPSRKHPYADRFHMKVPQDESLFDFSALFCGIGDGRHIYASLADIGIDLAERDRSRKIKASRNVKIHFTLIDIHPSALSRDLVILRLLSDLSDIPTARHKSDPQALDILLALHYTYWGTTMPPRAHAILEKALDKMSNAVKAAADLGVALDLNWLYIEPKTVSEIDTRLRWWQGEGKTSLSFDGILPKRIASDGPSDDVIAQLYPHDHEAMHSMQSTRHASMIKLMREDPRARERCEAEAKKMGMTTEEYINFVESIPPEQLMAHDHTPPNSHIEKEAFKYLKVMVPPPHANEPNSLEKVFRALRSGPDDAAVLLTNPEILEKAFESIRKQWRPNFTLLDKDWLKFNDYLSANLDHCPFQGTLAMFPEHYMGHLRPATRKGSIYDWSAQFFSLAADGMARLRGCGPDTFKLEVVLGDGYAIMEQIRLKTMIRDASFPTEFDRIHASNVPDYVGGYLASFTTAIPLLKPLPTSYFTSCSMLNSGIWEGGFMNGNSELNLDSALYTYAGVTRAETAAAYGVSIDCKPVFAANYHTFGRLNTLSKRLSRGQLMSVAYACFIKTVLPVKYVKHTTPGTVREVLNVHAFFRLMETFKTLGYASHVLADIIESILENRVSNSPRPHDVVPIPLASRTQLGALCTTPFQAEFEVAAAMWEPRLFPICSRLIPKTHDIVRYSVQFSLPRLPVEDSIPPTHSVLVLIFGLPRDLDADTTDLRKRLTDTQDCKTSIQLASTFDYDHERKVATFLLSWDRMEKFIQSGFEVALLNTIFWRIQSRKVPCVNMETVGDLDEWDKTRQIVTPQGRELTAREMQGWERDIMRGCYGPPSAGIENPMTNMLSAMGSMPGMGSAPPGFMDMMTSMLGSRS